MLLAGQDISLQGSAGHALGKLLLHRRRMLEDMHRLVKKDHCVFQRKQVEKTLCHRIEILDKALQAGKGPELPRFLRDPVDLCPEPVSLLRVILLPESGTDLVCLFLYPLKPVEEPPVVQDHLRRRKDPDHLQLLHRALAQDVEAADRIDLIPPQLYADRIFLGQIKNVQNIPAHSKLTGALCLVVFFISHGDQLSDHSLQIHCVPSRDLQDVVPEDPERDLGCQKSRKRRDDGHWLSLQDASETPEPLPVHLTSPQVCLIKNEISGGKQGSVAVIQGAVLGDLSGAKVAVGEHQAETSAVLQALLPAQRKDQMRLL